MILKHQHIESLFNEGLSFVDLLPYIEHNDQVFILNDGSLGQVWKISPLEIEGKIPASLDAMFQQWHGFLSRLPQDHAACQFILKISPGSRDRVGRYQQYREGDQQGIGFNDGRDLFHTVNGSLFTHAGNEFMLRNISIYVTLRYFPKWGKSASCGIESILADHQRVFRSYVSLIDGMFRSMGIHAETVSPEDFTSLLYGLLNPKRSIKMPAHHFNEQDILRDQMLFHFPKADPKGFILEETQTRVVSLKELPQHTTLGMLTKDLMSGGRFSLLDGSPSMLMVLNITMPEQQAAIGRIKMQKDFAFMHQENWLGDQAVESVVKKNELDVVIKELYQGGQRIIEMRMHWVLMGENLKSVEDHADRLINGLNRLQCEGIKEDLIGPSLFLTCLPLNFDPYYEKFIRRSRRLLSANAVDMLPVGGVCQGTTTPAQVYLNRRGEAIFFDLFDSNINPHGVIIGASGAGKSFFVNDFILQNERLGSHFFVLDKGDSYKKLCRIINGEYIAFDLNQPVTINPFAYSPTPENLSFLMSLLSQMASGGDERYRLSREEEGLLHQAVMEGYRNKGKEEVVLSDIVRVLNDSQFNDRCGINSLMGPTLALRLTPFTQKGPYGGFFDGQNQMQLGKRFTVFELANLSAYPDLQTAVLLNLMFFMTNIVSDGPMRTKRKYLLIDEAWSLLKVKNTADFITNAFKTFRKYRCATVAITQEIADLTRVESGIAIIANASNKIFLKQETAIIDGLKECLSLDDQKIEVLKTIETVKGKFSEALVISDNTCGVIRLVPDPFLYWVANSEPRNNQYLFDKVNEFDGDLMKALKVCAKEHPYGI